MLERTVYLFERGILGWQSVFGDWKQWPNQAVAWVNNNTPHKAQTLTYLCGFIFPALTRGHRAKNFARMLHQYEGWRIVIVAHSEGTATVLRALRIAGWPRIEALHLLCGACDSNFAANGLNYALTAAKVRQAFVYVAGRDFAMKLENTYLGSWSFGLETKGTPLGLNGPENMTPTAARLVTIRRWPNFGHSTCWDTAKEFERTMEMVTSE